LLLDAQEQTAMQDYEKRQQFAQNYALMADGELEELAKSASELTDIARDALHDEITRRGLTLASSDPPAAAPELRNLVILGSFTERYRADLAKTVLDSAGIRSLVSEDGAGLAWTSAGIGGRLWVREEDIDAANALLETRLPTTDLEEDEGNEQPSCPQCRSTDIFYDGPDSLGHPEESPDSSDGGDSERSKDTPRGIWKCIACGNEWRDEVGPATA
jgi:hypothetical protein